MPFIAIALLLAAAIGGGTSVAAQNALPGDALWGFKVGINENVQAALAPQGKAQADFDIRAIETRISEAQKLAANSKLTTQAQAYIRANFEAHANSAARQVAALEAKGDYAAAADVAARFQAAVAAQVSALAELTVEPALAEAVRNTLESASALSAQTSIKASSQ
jgi:hypothetical protein